MDAKGEVINIILIPSEWRGSSQIWKDLMLRGKTTKNGIMQTIRDAWAWVNDERKPIAVPTEVLTLMIYLQTAILCKVEEGSGTKPSIA